MTAMTVTEAAGIRDISRRCICDWDQPDWRLAPHLRRWTLARTDPLCLVHGHAQGGTE